MVENEVLPGLVKFGYSVALLMVTWFIGYRVIAFWDLRKKRQEIDVQTSVQFQALYGEAKEVNKLWRVYKKDQKVQLPESTIWEILKRAIAIESKSEALVCKLATERRLSQDEIYSLGLFRESIQMLRNDIRGDKPITFIGYGRGYHLFNKLAGDVSHIIAFGRFERNQRRDTSVANLHGVARVSAKDLLTEAAKPAYQNNLIVKEDTVV